MYPGVSGNDFWSFGNGNGSAHSQTLGTGPGMKNFMPICDENVKKTQDLNNVIEEVVGAHTQQKGEEEE